MEEITYRRHGDYFLPNLVLPEEPPVALGKYALLRKKYLKQHRRILYLNLLTAGTLDEHLMEVEQTAMSRMELLIPQMAAAQGVSEQLKADDQMAWVGAMNNIRHQVEETIYEELVYQ